MLEVVQTGAQSVRQVIEIENAAVVVRLPVQVHVAAVVEIDLHAPLTHGPKRLRSPGAAGLAVAGRRRAKDALHIRAARPFTPVELGDAVIPAQVRQIHGRAGLNAMEVGVVADLVLLQGRDDVGAFALFQGAGLLADDLEGRPDVFAP